MKNILDFSYIHFRIIYKLNLIFEKFNLICENLPREWNYYNLHKNTYISTYESNNRFNAIYSKNNIYE